MFGKNSGSLLCLEDCKEILKVFTSMALEKQSIFRRATGGVPCLDNLALDSYVLTTCVLETLRRSSSTKRS